VTSRDSNPGLPVLWWLRSRTGASFNEPPDDVTIPVPRTNFIEFPRWRRAVRQSGPSSCMRTRPLAPGQGRNQWVPEPPVGAPSFSRATGIADMRSTARHRIPRPNDGTAGNLVAPDRHVGRGLYRRTIARRLVRSMLRDSWVTFRGSSPPSWEQNADEQTDDGRCEELLPPSRAVEGGIGPEGRRCV
jgi:hypothetical protein